MFHISMNQIPVFLIFTLGVFETMIMIITIGTMIDMIVLMKSLKPSIVIEKASGLEAIIIIVYTTTPMPIITDIMQIIQEKMHQKLFFLVLFFMFLYVFIVVCYWLQYYVKFYSTKVLLRLLVLFYVYQVFVLKE